MLILALDTTTRAGSTALLRDDRLLVVATGDPARTHAERLPEALLSVLRRQHLALTDVDLFAVAAGPGSFTGLRIGIATIQGLAFALDRPVVAVSVLEALAHIARDDAPFVAAWMDAQRSEVFAALYRSPSEGPTVGRAEGRTEPQVVDGPVSEPPARVLDRWRGLTEGGTVTIAGDGVERYRMLLEEYLGAQFRTVERLPPLAPTIARMAAVEAARGLGGPPHAIRPIYVRRPDAELARDKKR